VNSRTFKDLWNEIQGLLSTCPVFKYFQGLEFRRKKFKYFQGCVGTLSDVVSPRRGILERKVANCCSVTFTCRSLMQKSTMTAILSTVKLPQEIYTGDVTIGP